MKLSTVLACLLVLAAPVNAQAQAPAPVGMQLFTEAPASCTAPALGQDTDATSGSQLMACEAGTFVTQGGGGGGLGDVVEDTTPQLGGQLDVNGNCLGDGTLELLCFTETGSAVNEVTIANAATGNAPTISSTGEVNAPLTISSAGSGAITLDIPGGSSITYSGSTFNLDGTGHTYYYLDRSATNRRGALILQTAGITDWQAGMSANSSDWELTTALAGTAIAWRVVDTSSYVNGLQLTPSATTDPVGLAPIGTDANIDLSLAGKGTGAVTGTFPKGELWEKDVDGTPASTITVTTAGTYYPWITSALDADCSGSGAPWPCCTGAGTGTCDASQVLTGVTADSGANATCTALDDPYACCTGSGTGTCGDLLIVTAAGDWSVSISMSYSGTNSSRATCCAFVNDAAPTGGPCFVRKLGTGGDVGSASSTSVLALAAGDEIDLRCTADSNADTIDIWTAHLTVEM